MNKKRLHYLLFFIVIAVAVFFRFWHMPDVPPSLNWDEVAFGYNAYSILKTGKDEFGTSFPLYFRSLDDYKLPVYAYLTVGSIAIFGYNDFAVRFSSAFLGVLTVITVYFLVKQLVDNGLRIADYDKKNKNSQFVIRNQQISQSIALLSALFLAILPWHIQFSRMAAEANAGLFFLTLGATLFLYGIRTYRWMLPCSILSLGLSCYSYLSFRVVAPLLGATLVLLYWKEFWRIQKRVLISMLGAVVLVGGILIWDLCVNSQHIRFTGTSVFTRQEAFDVFEEKQKEMFYDAGLRINLTRRLFHDNRLFTSADIVVKGYLKHFAPTFLFFDYDQKQHHTPFVGLCYIWMLPFIPLGLYFLATRFRKREAVLVILWILISPVAASVTWDIPHAIRAYGMVIPLVIVTACGVYYTGDWLWKKNKRVTYLAGAAFVFFVLLSSYYYLHQYMIHLPHERSKDWVYGRKEMTDYILKNKDKYDKIVISSELEWPYIFMLYYSKYDPKVYLDQGGTVSGGWGQQNNKYDTYEFHKFRAEDLQKSKALFVGTPNEFSDSVRPLYIINYLDGTPAIYIAEGNAKI